MVEAKAATRPVEAPEEVETVKPSDVTIIDAPRAAQAVSGATRAHPRAAEVDPSLVELLSRLPNRRQLEVALVSAGIETVDHLREKGPTGLRYTRGIGISGRDQILKALESYGIILVERVESRQAQPQKPKKNVGILDELIDMRDTA